jgi:flagellar basal-body rod protein FlgG
MWSAFRVAASGAQAQERVLDAAAHNLANAQTPAFKSRRVTLVDQPPGTAIFDIPTRGGGITMTSEGVGQGVTPGAVVTDSAPGVLRPTGQALDVAIVGDGYFEVSLPDGRLAYTRAGDLHVDVQGQLVTGSGTPLTGVSLPPGASHLTLAADGSIMGVVGGGEPQLLGRLSLARFANPDGLEPVGQNLLLASAASGPAVTGAPGSAGLGALASGNLEASNVDMAEEFTRIIQAQRAYQINLRALRTIDEMLQEANNIRH